MNKRVLEQYCYCHEKYDTHDNSGAYRFCVLNATLCSIIAMIWAVSNTNL